MLDTKERVPKPATVEDEALISCSDAIYLTCQRCNLAANARVVAREAGHALMMSETLNAASLAVAIAGLAFIWFQLRQSANSSKASLLIAINRDLNAYGDVAVKIERGLADDWVEKLDDIDVERLLDYISYFEGLYLAHRRGLFSLREINDYFSGRFFRLANNKGVQAAMLLNRKRYEDIFRPIFLLHRALLAYRSKSSLPRLYPQSDLANADTSRYREMTN